MVSELKPKNAHVRYTAELHQWLPSYLEVTENVGLPRFKRLLEFFDLNSSGSRVVLDAVKRFSNATKDECVDSFVDATDASRVGKLNESNARWEAVKNALYESLPSENKLAPETQLFNMKRYPSENLLEFVLRYKRLADEFARDSKVSDDRILQILYRKLPPELQRLMSTMDFSTTTLSKVELVVRNCMDWMAVSTPGLYNKKELGDYMDIDTYQMLQASSEQTELNAIRDKLLTSGGIQFDQITNENAVMVVWKELMKRPKYRREAERFLASSKSIRKPNGSGPSVQPTFMAHEIVPSDDDDEILFDSTAHDQQKSASVEDQTEQHCHLSIAPDTSKVVQTPQEEILVCNGVRSIEKSSMHLPVKLDDRKINALIDTGATNCFIQCRLVDSLGLNDRVKPCSNLVVMGNGVTEELGGKLALDVEIDGRCYPLDAFIIRGKGPPLILGYRFLADHNLVIDCRHKTLHQSDGPTIQCNSINSNKKSVQENKVYKKFEEIEAKVDGLATQVANPTMIKCRVLEQLLYLPFRRHGRIIFSFNRSWVLGPLEKRNVVLPFRFLPGTLLRVEGAVTQHGVCFSPQTNGERIWGVLDNYSSVPRHVTSKMSLCSLRSSITHLELMDGQLVRLEDRKSPRVPRVLGVVESTGSADPVISNVLADFPLLCQPGLGRCVDYEVKTIPFKHPLPRQQLPYQSTSGPSEETKLLTEIQKLIEIGAVEEVSTEPYLIPVFAIPKKTGDIRLVLDFRKFNSCVQYQLFLPVHREHTVAHVRPFAIGSALDLSNAYFQIPLAKDLHRYFGICVAGQFFQYRRLPFGYHNSPSEFLRGLQPVLTRIRRCISSQLVAYMDDLLLLSPSKETHLQDLRVVFHYLQAGGWRLRPDKCTFLATEFPFLGHVVTTRGWQPTASALDRFTSLLPPNTQSAWRSVKGWFQQLVRFIYQGTRVQSELRAAEESRTVEDWQRFIRSLLRHTIRCVHPLPSKGYGVGIDASQTGWGACLIQGQAVICCASGSWPKSWSHKRSNELEMEAVVHALQRFRLWIFGCEVVVYTDNSSVQSLANPDNHSDFIKRRLEQILDICPQFRFLPGRMNILPDYLSRQEELRSPQDSKCTVLTLERDVVDKIRDAHFGHWGFQTTLQNLLLSYPRWKNMEQHVREYIERCPNCTFSGAAQTRDLPSTETSDTRGERVSIDHAGPFFDGSYLLVIVDDATKWLEVQQTCSTDARQAIEALEHWISRWGKIQLICSDNANAWNSDEFRMWAARRRIDLRRTPSYHHRGNGGVERVIQTLTSRIRRMLNGSRDGWPAVIQGAVDAINTSWSSVTLTTPSVLMRRLDREGVLMSNSAVQEAWQKARKHAKKLKDYERNRFQNKHPRLSRPLRVGDSVLMRNYHSARHVLKKLAPLWIGPFRIEHQQSDSVWAVRKLRRGSPLVSAHSSQLKPYLIE
eukprot:g1394.t1